MKRLSIFLLFALLPVLAPAQDYVMYETQYLKLRSGHFKEFSEKITIHNMKFHAEGPYAANVWYVVNGPHSGKVAWAMGPCTFADLDKRPSGDPHDTDWFDNVLSHVEEATENEYWRLDQELSYTPTDELRPLIRVRILDIENGEMYRMENLLAKLKEVREKKNYPNRVSVFRNRFWSSNGRDLAVVMAFDKWADLDRESTMVKDYEEVHGEGTWRLFLQEWREVVIKAEEEYREHMPEMSGSARASATSADSSIK